MLDGRAQEKADRNYKTHPGEMRALLFDEFAIRAVQVPFLLDDGLIENTASTVCRSWGLRLEAHICVPSHGSGR